jgi:hypothetical protein
MMSQGQGQGQAQRPPRTSSARPDYNKPAPSVPNQRSDLPSQRQEYRQDDRYAPRPSTYETRPPPGAFQQEARYEGRASDARYDTSRPDTRYGVGSPPPANYGHGPPPQGYHGRPPIAQQARPPPTPAPAAPRDGNDREALWRLFGAVDKDSK